MESYCTKNCSECPQREELGCPGCKNGPGMYPCECEIAACCHEKDHEDCSTCTRNRTCAKFRRKERITFERKQEQTAAEEEHQMNIEKAEFLAKYVKILFWLVIPEIIAGLLSDIHPGDVLIFTILGETLSLAVAVIYGVTLLKMSPKDDNYSKSGILKIVAGAITFLMFLVFGVEEKPLWSILLLIPNAACELISEYREYSAHSNVLYTIDYDLSESWKNLRTTYVILVSIMYGNLLLTLAQTRATPMFISFMFLSGLGLIVVEVIKTVKLYKMCSCLTYHSYE